MENNYEKNIEALLKKAFLAQDFEELKNKTLLAAITNTSLSISSEGLWLTFSNLFKIVLILIVVVFGLYVLDSNNTEAKYVPTQLQIEVPELRKDVIFKALPMANFTELSNNLSDPTPKIKSLAAFQINKEEEKEEIKVYTPIYVEEINPSLTEEQIKKNNKLKENLLKDLLRINKKKFSRIKVSNQKGRNGELKLIDFISWNTEITNEEYRIFLNDLIITKRFKEYNQSRINTKGWTEWHPISFLEPMDKMYHWHPAYNEYPVVNIPRKGAELFCEWLTAELKKSDNNKNGLAIVRIPTNREWEYVASSGLSNNVYPWGGPYVRNDQGCFLANFKPGSNYKTSCMQGQEKSMDDVVLDTTKNLGPYVADGGLLTVKVDSYNPNKFGTYNISGNVSEMVTYPYEGNKIGARGGNWDSNAEEIKIYAEDSFIGVEKGSPLIGFRPVITFK